jgi:dihydrofolate synthase/folylpolyglutamate synthase
MKPANYPETLDFLLHQLPMFSRVGMGAYKKDLGNIVTLCQALDNPQHNFKSIHVAGTNGKGSVSHMLAAVFQEAGYKTGLYTSPHLLDFRERIRIDRALIDPEVVRHFVAEHFELITRVEPSFFEITVAMAFDWFSREQVDVAVIEVGLGGRLDSTNIITPELSVITNISYDHQQLLGNTLAQIAAEKAGIIKKGVPVVIGETHPETRDVFILKARELEAPISFADQNWQIVGEHQEAGLLAVEAKPAGGDDHTVSALLDLTGGYQKKNFVTVVEALEVLGRRGWHVDLSRTGALARVRELTGLHGRWEQVSENPRMIVDVAHNTAGIAEVTRQLASITYRNLHVVTGFVKDKSISEILDLLPREARYYFTQAAIPRALDAAELASQAETYGLRGAVIPRVKDAVAAARAAAGPEDLVLVTGSVFLVAEVLV